MDCTTDICDPEGNCTWEHAGTCGDGVVCPGFEACDDGNTDPNDACRDDCQENVCGDGVVEYGVEDCDDGGNEDGDGCSATCTYEPGFTCDGADPTVCGATCGTDFTFDGGPMGWLVDGSGGVFEHGTDAGGHTGFETVLDGDLPGLTETTITSAIAVPSLSEAPAPTLSVHYDLAGDGVNDCLQIYVNGSGGIATGQVFSTCTNTADSGLDKDANGFDVARFDLTADAGGRRYVVVRFVTDGADNAHPGAFVDRVTVSSDADADGSFEFASQETCDACVDADEDGWGAALSADTGTCPAGAAADCADDDADIHPGATEVCSGGVDDDCDGDTDLADSSCVEDCADGVDNGGNGLVDCEDDYCATDDYCDPCSMDWSFETGEGTWQGDAQGLWIYDDSSGWWQTGGGSFIDHTPNPNNPDDASGGVYYGRLNTEVTVPTVSEGGPAPELQVVFRHEGDDSPNEDKFGVCIDKPFCRFNTIGFQVLESLPTDGFVTGTVDLSPYVGQTITVSLLYDTVTDTKNHNHGVTVDRVRIASDVDQDGLDEGAAASCDPCWDADGDGYGRAESPDPSSCPLGPDPDCNDGDDGFFVNPGEEETLGLGVCGDGVDNDCDGDTDGFDDGCGDEDCANGLDDNGDGDVDCADYYCTDDPYCAPCSTGFDFETGEGGWEAIGEVAGSSVEVFAHGDSATYSEKGWETVLNAPVSDAGSGRVRAWLTRTVEIPADLPEPTIDVTYALDGQATTTKDVFGACLDVFHTACDAEATSEQAFATGANTAGLQTATFPVPLEARGSTVDVVLFFDTVDGLDNDGAGVFVADLTVRSDVDDDGMEEGADDACDHCIDMDGDGWGDASYPPPFDDVASCPGGKTAPDCDDDDVTTHPDQEELCFNGDGDKDNNCNGLSDLEEPSCTVCGDGVIGVGETCDDGNVQAGDGCSDTCQTESGALHLTEIHTPKPNGNPGEQWVEVHNATSATVDLEELDLTLRNLVGAVQSFAAGDCTVLTSTTVAPGGFYVIAFGPEQGTDGVGPDATCDSAFQIAPSGDRLTLEDGEANLLDVVDFTASFGCELQEATTADGVGRSMILAELPTGGTAVNKSTPSAWCMAGPLEDYSNTGKHRGTPGVAGGCAEFACDGVDDDCDDLVDEDLPDADGDTVCDEQDCDPASIRCAEDCTDLDGDGVFDCKDGCLDADADGYGDTPDLALPFTPGPDDEIPPPDTAACLGPDCDDQAAFVHPGADESSASGTCGDGQDNDCDGLRDCSDDACFEDPTCAGEICSSADVLSCGSQMTVAPAFDDFPCTDDEVEEGVDGVLSFTPEADEAVTIRLSNDGLNRYSVFVFEGTCQEGACDEPLAGFTTGCANGGAEVVDVTAGADYFVVVDRVGSCSEGSGSDATVSLACSEVCDSGVDEDLDGAAGCADEDCALEPACGATDFDDDGVDNATEITCGTDPVSAESTPNNDDVQDLDDDGQVNCVDEDDDGDGYSDEVEQSQCDLNSTAKNDASIHPGAEVTCEVNVDQDCNGILDHLEAQCGGREQVCDDAFDDDDDGLVDCQDPDCAEAAACAEEDFDGDGVINGFELDCGSDPLDAGSVPPPGQADDPDGDGEPNCVDLDDDGDGFPDVQELICGSDHLDADVTPTDTDGDTQCDAVDSDDDNDGFDDQLEAACGSDPKSADSTPVDAEHDIDQDGTCNEQDPDMDGDGWSDTLEETCGTDPTTDQSDPVLDGFDMDGDGLCDAVDPDDDGDLWDDDKESLCGTDKNDPADVPEDVDGNGRCDALDQDQDDDGWANGVETLCGTDPQDAASNPTVLGLDQDGDHNCDALDSDDDGDGWDDALEEQCETDAHDPEDVPVDTDGDSQCDAVDKDDDGDGWLDDVEKLCGTDPLDAGSVPVDEDGDGLCDAVDPDADPDQDGWSTASETFCETDPKDPDSVPTDLDGDGLCDNRDSDMDGDGWSNAAESACETDPASADSTPTDTDNDSLCDPVDKDDDADGIPDADEIMCGTDPLDPDSAPLEIDLVDTDGDGEANCVDSDDDGDGVPDAAEEALGSDPLDPDTDGDGLDDGVEDANRDGVTQDDETSPTSKDTDGDGVEDGVEVESCYPTGDGDACEPSDPTVADTDGDGLPDGVEDADGDGVTDAGETSPLDPNSDGDFAEYGDEATDGLEAQCATDPLDPDDFPVDKDEDGTCDGSQVDTDGDGVADGVETFCGFDPQASSSTPSLGDLQDPDGDGLISCVDSDDDDDGVADADEIACGTDPRDPAEEPSPSEIADYDGDGLLNCEDADDDDDGLSDTEEEQRGTDPRDADSDEDGLSDGQEVLIGTDPLSADTDGDGVQDGTEFGRTEGTEDTDEDIFVPDADPSTTTDPRAADTDGDLVCDGPNDVDGVCEGGEDLNANGAIDGSDEEPETDPNDPSDGLADSDGDGLTDRDELLKYGTDPKDQDTDGDLLDDKLEVEGVGDLEPTDPLDPDTDGGGVKDGDEIDNGTDPNDPEDDFDPAGLSGENFVGCTSGGGDDFGLGLFLALGILLSVRMRRRVTALFVACLAIGAAAGGARAQVVGNANVQNFMPAGGHYRVWSVEESLVAPAWKPYAAVLYHLEENSFRLDAGRHEENLVDSAQHVNVALGMGLFNHLQLDVSLPVAVSMESDSDTTSIAPVSGAGLGDMVVRLRGRAINNYLGGVGLALTGGVTVPVGDEDRFRGDPGVGVLAGAILDWRTEWTVFSLNSGVRVRTEEAEFLDRTFGNELTYGLGLEVFVVPQKVTIATELFGRTPFDDLFGDRDTTTLEALAGPKWWIVQGLALQAAAGAGIVKGIGTPSFRFVAGLQWAPGAEDGDGDGIPDGEDRCPMRPEDVDGFADMDGCPDDDNDEDGIPDLEDRCPNKPEDFNGIEDMDGCPDEVAIRDADGDGIPDKVDRCPLKQEVFNEFQDGDGCPDEAPEGPMVAGGARVGSGETGQREVRRSRRLPEECRISIEEEAHFTEAGAWLTKRARIALNGVARRIKANRSRIATVYVNGHADEEGADPYNLWLSKKRAESAAEYLVGRGVSRDLLELRGFGESFPKVDARSEDAMAENRRVDFTVVLGGRCAQTP
ncbi:MAG: OmpA family protein [Myxococcota bacterium]